jgi:hypothetical protein
MLWECPSGGHSMPHVTAAACGSALTPCRSRQRGLSMGQCLTELFVYKLYIMYCGTLLLVLLALRAVTGKGYLVP